MDATRAEFLDALSQLAPGTAIRKACERIIQQHKGALLVIGQDSGVEEVCTGGFELSSCPFSVARMGELAKMDGAIIIDADATNILKANVHLVPDSTIPTAETGSRHRTAERVAIQTGKPVVSISEHRGVATLLFNGVKHELETPAAVIARVNESLHTLERFRRRLDDAIERLDTAEVNGLVNGRHVVTVLLRAELVSRIATQIESDTVALGGEAEVVRLQTGDLMSGVDQVTDLVFKDYLLHPTKKAAAQAHANLHDVAAVDLSDIYAVAAAVEVGHPDTEVAPRGYRILSGVPRLPDSVVKSIISHFPSFEALLTAEAPQLAEVDGIGSTRAAVIHRFIDRRMELAGRVDI